MKFFALLLALTCGVPLAAHAQAIQIRATGEHRAAAGQSPDAAQQLALVDARRKVWREAVKRLETRADVKALQLKPGQLEAYAAVLVEIEEQPAASARKGTSPVQQAAVRAAINPNDVVARMAALRKDQDATFELMAAAIDMQRSQDGRDFTVRLLAAKSTAALAQTEPGTIGGRSPSAEGRRQARQFADAALAIDPGAPDANFVLGDWFVDARQPEAAEAAYRKGLDARSNSTEGRRRLAEALRLQGKQADAETELRRVIRDDPSSARAHTDLALVLRGLKRIPEAITEYREALRLDPELLDARNNLSIVLANQGALKEAEAGFREIIRLDPDSAQAYFNLATTLANLDRDVESAAALRDVIRINPDHYNARYNLGELLRLEGKFDDAARQFAEYVRLAPADTPASRRNIERAKGFIAKFSEP
jgi:tetratricopeptide (TPR) repeat protein